METREMTAAESEQLASFMSWHYDHEFETMLYGSGMFTLDGHLAVVGVVLATCSPEAAIASLHDDLAWQYPEATDTAVREAVYEAATLIGMVR